VCCYNNLALSFFPFEITIYLPMPPTEKLHQTASIVDSPSGEDGEHEPTLQGTLLTPVMGSLELEQAQTIVLDAME